LELFFKLHGIQRRKAETFRKKQHYVDLSEPKF
jgi:hypothetical protein